MKASGLEVKNSNITNATSIKGVTQLVFEAIDNSVDEFMNGFGTEVDVHVAADGTVTVTDHGRGVPVGVHPTLKDRVGNPLDTLTVVFTHLHAGGKFGASDSGYKSGAGGLHGIGVKAINALSAQLIVTVKRNSMVYRQEFKQGEPITGVTTISGNDVATGTIVSWLPDPEIFKTTLLPDCRALQVRLEELAALNAGLTFNYHNEATEVSQTYYDPEGLRGYPRRLLKDVATLYDNVFYLQGHHLVGNRDIQVEIAWLHVDQEKPSELIKTFANNIATHEGGFHLQGFRRAYDDWLSKLAVAKNMTKEKIELGYLLDGIIALVSVKLPEAEFEGQTKTKLGNEEAKEAVEVVMAKLLPGYNNTPEVEAILTHALRVKEAEEAARKARVLARQGNKVKKTALPGKLSDCASRTGYSELFVVEGDSAAGSCKMGRNREFQAVLPLRGKVLNIERVDVERLLKSEAITNIISALGTGIGKQFNIKQLRYDKVIILADADADGEHVSILLLTLFYRYMVQLIEAGHIYVAQPPLYRILYKKQVIYLKDDHELKQWTTTHRDNYEVNRFKGLGEMGPNQLWETTLDPANRQLIRVELNDAAIATQTFERLMGEDAQPRRDFIEANAYKVDLTLL